MRKRDGWIQGAAGTKVINGSTYKNLTEFTRACAACGKPFSIFVTSRIAAGHADSNSFGLKNCVEHRRNKSIIDAPDTQQLRTANVTMRDELTALYEENRQLKARLASYELPGALAAARPLTFPWGSQ